MKKILITGAMCVIFAAAGCQNPSKADGFVINGEITGVPDGYSVTLRSREGNFRDTVYTKDGKFVYTGSVAAPVLAEIFISDKDGEENKVMPLMVENGEISFYAPSFDSIPPSWYMGSDGKKLEKNVVIKGGEAQKEYQEYADAIFPYEVVCRDAHKARFWPENKKELTDEEKDSLAAAQSQAELKKKEAVRKFIDAHPSYNISMLLMGEELDAPFNFSGEELDAILASVENSKWTSRRDSLKKDVERYRSAVKMTPYIDFEMENDKGEMKKLSDYVGKGNYVFIDFWASWCGPCRAAIPHVKELYAKYPEGLTIISVSVDKVKEDWVKAMDQEKMPWTQLWADTKSDQLGKAYRFTSIPTLVVIDPEGRILMETHSPDDVTALLADKLK